MKVAWATGLATFIVGSAVASLAPSIGVLIAGRVIQGLGGGLLEPLMLTAIARAAGPTRIGRAMSIVAAVIALGPLLGPIGGGALVYGLDWRWLFAAFVPLGLASLVLAIRLLPPSKPAPARLDVPGLLLLSGGVVGVLLFLSRVAGESGADALAIAGAAVGVLALAGYLAYAPKKGLDALAPLEPFRTRGFALGAAVMALLGSAIYPLFYGLPMFFQDTLGYGAMAAGLLLAPHGLGAMIGMATGSRLSDRYEARGLVVLGAVLAGAGAIAYLALGVDAPIVAYLVASFFTGLGTGLVGGPTVATIYRVLSPELTPAGSALLFILNQIGGAIGIAIMTLAITTADPLGWTAGVGMWPMLVPAVGSIAILAVAVRLPLLRSAA